MKKIAKIAVGITLAASIATSAGVLAGCGDKATTGEAYGYTHTNGCSYATVTVKGGKVTGVTLDEVFIPGQGGFKPAEGSYTKITYGDVVIDYVDGEYKVGDVEIKEYLFKSEANAKAYYEAAMGGKMVATKEDGTTETVKKENVNKELFGYWTINPGDDDSFTAYSQWVWNRNATLEYVKANGVEALNTLTKGDTKVTLPNGKEVAAWVDANNVSTGASWSDLWNPTATDRVSYGQLILNAYAVATK